MAQGDKKKKNGLQKRRLLPNHAHGLNAISLESEHRSQYGALDGFCRALSTQLGTLLEQEKIALGSPIQFRVKSVSSILEKLERNGLSVASIHELQDLAGLRVMLLFLRDVDRTCDIVERNFDVERKYNTVDRLAEDQFGYSSVHFVLRLPQRWLSVPTLAPYANLRAEVQVRTLAQHIWAASSHILQYKHEDSVPHEVRRAIHRASALLETIDLEFERVLVQRERYRESIGESHEQVVGEALNVDLLAAILDSSFPAKNKVTNEPYADALSNLKFLGINTASELKRILAARYHAAIQEEEEILKRRLEEVAKGEKPVGTTRARLDRGVYFTHVGLLRQALAAEVGEARLMESMGIKMTDTK